nr:hypothetical protein [Kibdelosporangium sp. MJ126-NF4]CEL15087.1 hypothetical protein [Kibdelosporangium sp. MJ126-NF4]CTQ93319.1 hypothetical protein [Kibdelosporangium sp. MJ126-NF4]
MSAADVLRQFGTVALLRFLVVLLLFLALHLTRLPLVVLARVLEIGMHLMDRALVTGLSPRPRRDKD